VVHRFFAEIIDVGVASKADTHRVGLGQPGLARSVRTVAIGAISRGAGMRHFGGVDQFGLVVMAGHAH